VHHEHDPDDETTLSGNDLTTFYEDSANGLWIGTAHGGISRYDPTWAKFPVHHVTAASDERMSNNSIWRFAPSAPSIDDTGRVWALWVSTFAGLNYWDRTNNTVTFYEIDPYLPDIIAYAIYEDTERGTLWLGTTMGLERIKLPPGVTGAPSKLDITRILTRTSSSRGLVTDLYPAGDDQLWLAHYEIGLSRFDLRKEVIVATFQVDPENGNSLSDDRLTDITAGKDGTLWLTTPSGIERFDPATGMFTPYLHDPDDPQSVAERVLALYQDKEGIVWLGTEGSGLQRFDPRTGHVTTRYREAEGLPNNVIYSIVPDETGRLWLSTNKGLAQFDPEAETIQAYTAQDGLQSNEFNLGAHFRTPDGELFFGGVDGINAFYPQDVGPNPYVPPVVITEILLGPPRPPIGTALSSGPSQGRESLAVLDSPPNTAERIQLSYRDRILSFEFAALHYALPERNQYAYRMEGFDKDWSYAGNRRFATYTNLPPGTYTFRVKGTNADGVWNEAGASLAVIVKPPFWDTWWFRGLIGALLIGGVITGYRTRVRNVEIRSQELERQVTERTRELSAVNAIAAVVSHSLDLDTILIDALDETLAVMTIEAGGIYLLDETNDLLTLAVQRGLDTDLVAQIDGLEMGEGFSGHVAQSGDPLVVQNVATDPRLTRSAVQDEELHALAAVPLQAKGKILGTLFAVTQGYREFSERDVDLLTAIGHQIGVAVENANLYRDTRNRLAQLTALQETAMAVTGTLELGRLLRLIVQQATDLLQAEGGILNLVDWDMDADEVVAAIGSAASTVGRHSSLRGSLSGWATLHRQTVTLNDPSVDDRVDQLGLAALEG
jgi:putative methionine-R-sulfoxide reductase with GAF domain